jgi:uncharacterized protein (TIGR03083 family)
LVNSDSPVRIDVNDIAADAVERERGASGNEILARWVKSADDMVDTLEACDPAARVLWVAGDMAPRTLATTRLAETWIHTGDVCIGLRIGQPKSDRIWHIARLVHRTLPYSFLRAGCEPTGGVRFNTRPPPTSERCGASEMMTTPGKSSLARPSTCAMSPGSERTRRRRRCTALDRRRDRPSHHAHIRVVRDSTPAHGIRHSARNNISHNVHGDSSPR